MIAVAGRVRWLGSSHDHVSAPLPSSAAPLDWSEDDDRAIAYLRALAADAVQRVGNGHPGTAMSLAPVAYLLFQKVMRHDPATRSGSAAIGSSCPMATPASRCTASCSCPATDCR